MNLKKILSFLNSICHCSDSPCSGDDSEADRTPDGAPCINSGNGNDDKLKKVLYEIVQKNNDILIAILNHYIKNSSDKEIISKRIIECLVKNGIDVACLLSTSTEKHKVNRVDDKPEDKDKEGMLDIFGNST